MKILHPQVLAKFRKDNSVYCLPSSEIFIAMLTFHQNVSLLPFNTFHIDAKASHLVKIHSLEDVHALRENPLFSNNKKLFLGGGSNILFTQDFNGLVIKNEINGISTVNEDESNITLRVGSGENWHSLVMYCVEQDLGGIENLSLIPGTVGAAPMQNIGAYGVEVKDVIVEVEALELETGRIVTFSKEECRFGYRESFFKHEGKNKFFISSITLTLTKKTHNFNVSYGAIKETLLEMGSHELSVRAISDAVIRIRKSKLPDPEVVGNAGSFFKNPSISVSDFQSLQEIFPMIPGYKEPNDKVKVPAGWLIEQCGWKGKSFSSIGVHPLQALVLVNYGEGKGDDIWQLALDIQESVRKKFNIELHPEVNII
jgi:UDP-N-acetylmuramate dehydrogenase